MSIKTLRVGRMGVLVACTLSISRLTYAQTGNCAQVIDQVDSQIRAFDAEARQQSVDFVVDNGVEAAIDDAKKIMMDQLPDHGSAQELEYRKAKIEAWDQLMSDYGVSIEDVEQCVLTPGCNLLDFSKRENEALRKWLESFASAGTQTALSRVRQARDLLQDYTRRLTKNATGSIGSAVTCMNDYIQRGTSTPVDVRPDNSTPSKSKQRNKPKMSKTGAAILIGSIVGGGSILAGVAAANASQANQQQDCSAQYLGSGIGSLACSNALYDAAQCQADEAKAQSYCACEGYSTYISTSQFGDFGIVPASQVCR